MPGERIGWIDSDGIQVEISRSTGHYRFYFPEESFQRQQLPRVMREYHHLPITHRIVQNYYGMTASPSRPYTMAEVLVPGRYLQPWHIDCLRPGVKAMLYLNDVTAAQAPFRYIVGSHRPTSAIHRQIYWVGRSGLQEAYYDEAENQVLDSLATVFTAPANTLLLFDNRGQHAGSICREGMRIVLVNGFRPASGVRVNPRFFPDCPLREQATKNVYSAALPRDSMA
jgi:hypothetical protein